LHFENEITLAFEYLASGLGDLKRLAQGLNVNGWQLINLARTQNS